MTLYEGSLLRTTRNAKGLRILLNIDGTVCWFPTMYLTALFRRGLALQTVNTYASQLSIFCNYLTVRDAVFADTNDALLHEFRNWLEAEPHTRHEVAKRRGGRQINKIISRAILFLIWYQRFRHPEDQAIVGKYAEAPQTIIEKRSLQQNGKRVKYLWHASMAPRDVPRDVLPMSRAILLRLLDACDYFAKSRFVKARMRLLLGLLADTGCRRSEAIMLKIGDILQARDNGLLLLQTAKRSDCHRRLVPVPSATMDVALSFIDTHRGMLINRLTQTGVIEADPQWLFLTIRGEQLSTETLTQDFARLRIIADISEPATAHMLRHRWITIQVAERFKAYANRKIPADITTTILTKVASLTGHRSIESLWSYVDLAFAEIGVWDSADEKLSDRFETDALFRALQSLCAEARNGSAVGFEMTSQINNIVVQYVNALSKRKVN